MEKYLVIVESPSKSRTIEKYLGSDYKVVASLGHIRNLAISGKYGLGIDIDNNFKPDYEILKEKKKVVAALKKEIIGKEHIYLATDPDREGEAISWHLKEVLGLKNNFNRLMFNEITKDKILESINNPKEIDNALVKSQETRMMLDKIIGFRLSNLVMRKTSGKSAGRVQSVALKLIVDREREIMAFIKEEYWTITSIFPSFEAELFKYHNENIEIKTEKNADHIISNLDKDYIVTSIEEKNKTKKSKVPFITSSLQQNASNKLNFNAKKTMKLAQGLYEGINIKEGPTGLITYMRTDSIRLSDDFVKTGYKYINDTYGNQYVGYLKTSKKKENIQDAHEAIRPTNIYLTPDSIKEYLSNDEYKLYKMIYYRTLASLMSDAKVKATSIILDNNGYQFKATGQILLFDGYLKVYNDYETSEDKILPDLKENMKLTSDDVLKTQHFTEPPARYTEAKLIKEMEELGIGRPSTYATIIDTIKLRKYVDIEDKKFIPTKIGIEVTDKLQEYFKDIINVKYTANMENNLDKIAYNQINNIDILKEFYSGFETILNEAFQNLKKDVQETGEMCPNCNSPLVIKNGRFGEFTACSNYPSCKYIKKEEKTIKEICNCPKCDGKIIEKKTKKNKIFYGCSNYPKCKVATWDLPTGDICKECGSLMIKKDEVIKCSSCNK